MEKFLNLKGAGTKRKTDQSNLPVPPVKKSEKERPFQQTWLQLFPWLKHDAEKKIMFCSWCRDKPRLADSTSPLFKVRIENLH